MAASSRPHPTVVDGGEIPPGTPWGPPRRGVQEIRQVRAPRRTGLLPGSLLWLAGLVIAAVIVGGAYVAYESQRAFQYTHNHHDPLRALISAAIPDLGWTALAAIALVAALRGRSALRARVGTVIFFGLSTGSQLLYAEQTVAGYVAAIVAPLSMAYLVEVFLDGVRRWAATRRGESAEDTMPVLLRTVRLAGRFVRGLGGLLLWVLRLLVDRKGTLSGLRAWIIDTAPYAPGRSAIGERAHAAELQAADAAAEARKRVDEAEQRAFQAEQHAADEIARERERTQEIIRDFAAYTKSVANSDRPDVGTGLRRWPVKADGFRAIYAELLATPDSLVWDPSVSDSAIACYIAERVIGMDGTAMSASGARRVLYEIYEQQGRPGDCSPDGAGSGANRAAA